MLKYLSKFTLDILPSVVATIVGAYIVNHFIVTKPGAVAPVAAVESTAEPKAEVKTEAKADAKVVPAKADASTDVANIHEPGVRAKGISEKLIFERSAVEKPVEKSAEKPAEKSADKPAETVSIPAETRRRPAPSREKAVAKAVAAPPPPVIAPVAPNPAPPVEAAIAPDTQFRDANDIARAAIERLRANDGATRPQETARVPDVPRAPDPRIVSAPPLQPLPPPIMVSTPVPELLDSATGSVRVEDPRRPIPPADIPSSRPLDLHVEVAEPAPRPHTNVAEDVLLAAKSVIHKVLPNSSAN